MTQHSYSTDVLELSAGSGYTVSSSRSKSGFWSKKRVIFATVTGISVVALALGLGLGLGLSSDDPAVTEPAVTSCRPRFNSESRRATPDSRFFTRNRVRVSNTTWVPESCPTPGVQRCPAGFTKKHPPLFLLSLDGFRAEYLLRGATPMLQRFIDCGLHAPYMRAMFPTKTFPNHYTLVTGLYAESHGIIDNYFYDPLYKEIFSYGGRNRSDNRWWGGEPIWNTATKAGLKVATVMWVGSDVNIQGIRPEICYDYDSTVPLDVRVNEILSMFDGQTDDYPDLVVFYFEQPDSAGHAEGPYGDAVIGNLTYVDGLVSDLVRGLTDRGLGECFNFIVVADHGMESVSCSDSVDISQYLDTQAHYTVYTGAHSRMSSQYLLSNSNRNNTNHTPTPVPVDETLERLRCLHYNETKDWYVRYHYKGDLPKRYHYSLHRRIDEIVMDIENEFSVVNTAVGSCSMSPGNHGYDNTLSSMHAIFIAYGPAFKQNIEVEEFENIELYNLLADILDVTPAPNNGTYGLLHNLLYDPPSVSFQPQISTTPTDLLYCSYPDDVTEREERRNRTDCQCKDWASLTEKSIEEADDQLHLSVNESESSLQTHLPMGAPASSVDDVISCVLVQKDYVLGYSQTYNMSMWAAARLNKGAVSVLERDSSRSDLVLDSCYRGDVRVTSPVDCSAHNNFTAGIQPTFLYPPGFSNGTQWHTDAYISSNVLPMYTNFRRGVWRELLHLIEEYSESYGLVQFLVGPGFDYNMDGLRDSRQDINRFVAVEDQVPLPSHYFAVVTRCRGGQVSDSQSCLNETDVQAFILPHKASYTECWDKAPRDYLRRHVARVKDVELLTGLTFFPDLLHSDPPRYRRLVTHLSERLWRGLSWLDTPDQQCRTVEGPNCPHGYDKSPVILVSLDGFRPDYLERGYSPTLEALRSCGLSAEYMHPAYPSMTFPNHHTISTGLYPESHGIVDNSMYSVELNESFYLGSASSTDPAWWGGEPIWTTLELNNKTSMTYFWPGSDVPFQGIFPRRYMPYNGKVPYTLRIDTVLQWLNNSEGVIPDLVVLYLSKVDSSGHDQGPNSNKVNEAIRTVDEALLRLMDGLHRLRLDQCVNIVIVSDHGMSDISCTTHSVLVSDVLPPDVLSRVFVYTGSNGRISNKYTRAGDYYFPVPEHEQVSVKNLTESLSCELRNLVTMDTRQMPVRYHYSNSPRLDEVQLLMADSWLVGHTSPPYCSIKGQHGWDPRYENMKAIFIAYGPAFRSNLTVQPFSNIEIYNLLAHLTNTSGAANNGTDGSLYHLLREPPPIPPMGLLPEQGYGSCLFPPTDDEYWERANSNCSRCNEGVDDIRRYDERLNTTLDEQSELRTVHTGSLGVPALTPEAQAHYTSACLLHHTDYISAYSTELRLPLWTAFLLRAQQVNGPGDIEGCIRTDVRLKSDEQSKCDAESQHLINVQLFPSNWSSSEDSRSETLLTSNSAPMVSQFYTDVWTKMLQRIAEWAVNNSNVQVIVGPAFDHNSDSLLDENITRTPDNFSLASHYFVVTSRCVGGTTVCVGVDTQAFLLPHRNRNKAETCLTFEEYLKLNTARVRDVELLTGLEFFTSSAFDSDRQSTIQFRTFFNDRLWT